MTAQRSLLVLAGTRPEVIKQAPVLWAAARSPAWDARLVVTGQHRDLCELAVRDLGVEVSHSLDLMTARQTPTTFLSSALNALEPILRTTQPDWIAVQGDTTTALAGAIAGFYARIPVLHVEAGLRTHNLGLPFPEEGHRQLISRIASAHAAPTDEAARCLEREGVPRKKVLVSGNTGIDCLLEMAIRHSNRPEIPAGIPAHAISASESGGTLVFVTIHRRESIGPNLTGMCRALARCAREFSTAHFILPVHPNPSVREAVVETLSGLPNFHLVEPLSYSACVWVMKRATFLVTDSGGLQEEGPALGKPVLVMRDVTERPEAIACGSAMLIGCSEEAVHTAIHRFLDAPQSWQSMTQPRFPYGDGKAAARILAWLANL